MKRDIHVQKIKIIKWVYLIISEKKKKIIPSLIWFHREKYNLLFGICYDIVGNRAIEHCNAARITLCLLLSILKD